MAAILTIMRALINHLMPKFLPGKKYILKIRLSNLNRKFKIFKLAKILNIQLNTSFYMYTLKNEV